MEMLSKSMGILCLKSSIISIAGLLQVKGDTKLLASGQLNPKDSQKDAIKRHEKGPSIEPVAWAQHHSLQAEN